ncbi:hypothetical protein GUJ93_ZPchr0006g42706 [Zizania palustris]|uniref:PGG domain-containing protein n=1 Tax=Zizania palustris TaxID=103762 RepID=A0A8J5T251_ZIZPA|nr:hypothetical protein GUJ93_ZPchr0006g42706 [Zizania palustris]
MDSVEQPSNSHTPVSTADEAQASEAELLWKLRKYLMLLAILAAAITFQAGLAPPGGFWQEGRHGYLAGDVVLRYSYHRRYLVFFYCNTTAFGASLIVLVLLLVKKEVNRNWVWLRSLQFTMVLGLLGLMGAYAAGSCREVRTSIYIWALLVGIFAYITLHVIFFRHLAPQWLREKFYDIRKHWKEILGRIFKRTDEPETPGQMEETGDSNPEKNLEQNRSFLLVLASLAATVTYTAGLNPPGGFWPDDSKPSHLAGDPVLRDHYPRRFKAFLICNATAFAGSLVIIIMLLSNTAVDHVVKSNALRMCVVDNIQSRSSVQNNEDSVDSGMPSPPIPDKDDVQKLRTYLLLLGILAATVTYQAGLNPPGGFWQDNEDGPDGHTAGDPIWEAINHKRYNAFFYCNATAFVASLVIITLLQSQPITVGAMKRHILQTAMLLDLFGLMGAYAAGSSRKLSKSVYVFCLAILVFTYVVLHVLLSVALKTRLRTTIDHVAKKFHSFTKDCFRRTDGGSGDGLNKLEKQQNEEKHLEKQQNEEKHLEKEQNEEKHLEKQRKFLMLLAILAASITYQSGLSPPGGFWSDNKGHREGDPVLHDEFPRRYRVFFYFNATAFMASLAVIMLLVNKRLCHKGLKSYALRFCVLVDLVSLMGAFAAGSCRRVLTSIYVILVVGAVFVYVMIQVLVLTFAREKVNSILERFKNKPAEHQQRSMNQNGSIRGKRTVHKWRKDLMLIGTLAVTVTYQAGLLPPGGLWPSDVGGEDSHFAGDSIFKVTHPIRYKVFFYCNATAFMASMLMVILLLNNTISKYKRALFAMKTAMVAKLVKRKGKKWMPCLEMWDLIETEASEQPSVTQPGEVHPPV